MAHRKKGKAKEYKDEKRQKLQFTRGFGPSKIRMEKQNSDNLTNAVEIRL